MVNLYGNRYYSTKEHVVGTWVDGSPLYEITLQFNSQSVPTNSYATLDISGLGCNKIIDMEAFCIYGETNEILTLPYFVYTPNGMAVITAQVNDKNTIYLSREGELFTANFIITLRYTKATS